MVNVDDLIKTMDNLVLVESAAREVRQIVIAAEARARCSINDYNNEVNYLIRDR